MKGSSFGTNGKSRRPGGRILTAREDVLVIPHTAGYTFEQSGRVYDIKKEIFTRTAENVSGDSGVFIEITLSAIFDIIALQERHQVEHQVELSGTAIAVLKALEGGELPRREIFSAIGKSGDSRAFKRNIEPLIDSGLIEMTVPERPKSKLQRYRLTGKGAAALNARRRAE